MSENEHAEKGHPVGALIMVLIIVALAVTGFRTAVFNAVPAELKAAIAAGIGAFIAFIGFVDSGFVRRVPDSAHTTVPVQLGHSGSIATWPVVVFVIGLLVMGVLTVRRVPGGLLIGIVVTTVLAIIIEAVALVAREGYRLLPDYTFDARTGLWHHRCGPFDASHRTDGPAVGGR